MKYFTLTFIVFSLTIATISNAQKIRSCSAHEASENQILKDTNYANNVKKNEKLARTFNTNARLKTTPYIIPVVVHVLYNTPEQNVSDEQIFSQIKVLNDDYNLTNANFSSATPSAFKPLAGIANIQFVLAKRDPNGKSTTGITRTSTASTQFLTDDKMKFKSSGGIEAWNNAKYLNIWVCNLTDALGYAYYPGGSSANDGLVIAFECFGTTGSAKAPFHLGRTATHEIGHYLNLQHIWGSTKDCNGNDQVSDTPQQKEPNFNCRTFPYKVCPATSSDGEMYVNYMDYTPDDCMSMFSAGQVSRMTSALLNSRASLLTSDGATPVTTNNDAGITNIISPLSNEVQCTSVTPQIEMSNIGTDILNSADVKLFINNKLIQTIKWTGSLNQSQSTIISFNSLDLINNINTLKFIIEKPNNTTDQNQANDSSIVNVSKINSVSLPIFESFESLNFPPTNWSINNPENNNTWESTSTTSFDGTKSLVFKNFNATALNGQHDELISPQFKVGTKTNLSFYYAYKVFTYPYIASDTLTISISTDCGKTKTELFKSGGEELAVIEPKFYNGEYEPQSILDWKKINISLDSYLNQDAILYFDNKTEYENNLYIDSIFIDSNKILNLNNTEINESLTLAPNPTENIISIKINGGYDKVNCFNLLGNLVLTSESTEETTSKLDLSQLPRGIYIVKIKKGQKEYLKKIILK